MTLLFDLALAGPLPADTAQLLLVVLPDADSSYATLQRARRDPSGWHTVGERVPARVGAAGAAWGRGLHPPQPGLQKVEGDLRSPMGVFELGDAYRDSTVEPMTLAWPLVLIGPRDLWVEDPSSPHYNEHLVVPGSRALLPWEEAARMRLGDAALALKVFVEHNAPPSVQPGAGSAIFLHGHPVMPGGGEGEMATAGCTALERAELVRVLSWLQPQAHPVFVLLTEAELARLARPWGLPAW
jgi:L,D-peptidoglycan transpeptidase YkuD (ErfK/YbiS/YcfS/YnhG family)